MLRLCFLVFFFSQGYFFSFSYIFVYFVRSYDPSYDLTIYAFSIPQRSLVGSRF
jgi:hypothetical protein